MSDADDVNPMRCPRCGHHVFEVRVTVSGVDFDVDVTGCELFELDQQVIERPDLVQVEAVCRNCHHGRFVDLDEWVWA